MHKRLQGIGRLVGERKSIAVRDEPELQTRNGGWSFPNKHPLFAQFGTARKCGDWCFRMSRRYRWMGPGRNALALEYPRCGNNTLRADRKEWLPLPADTEKPYQLLWSFLRRKRERLSFFTGLSRSLRSRVEWYTHNNGGPPAGQSTNI